MDGIGSFTRPGGGWWSGKKGTSALGPSEHQKSAQERLDDLVSVGKHGRPYIEACRTVSPTEWSGRTRTPSHSDTSTIVPPFLLDDEANKPSQETCPFCNRKPSNVVCRACGHAFEGRVRLRCSVHPEIIHLMDYSCCPECRNSMLKEYMPGTLAEKFC